ncbi:hypothetical protein LJB42_004028 [Komagataella kurtzmanii]|nr:hypothetical protein LJB42_004028 [Komagataella kurtzmanii]
MSGKRNFSLWNIWVASTLLKVLLYPAYHSTDFDVHRNWLAITNKLPLKEWYLENTSQWTLDYPPFFAYFEWFLSQFVPASVADDGCLDIIDVGNYGWPTVVFQRSTVILSEIVLFLALQKYINISADKEKARSFVVASSIALSPGLLIVDHIHFQYNGMMFGILIFSLLAVKQKKYLQCGALFSVLLCFKHIFLYIAPAYFVFLLRVYCLDIHETSFKTPRSLLKSVRWSNLFKLGFTVITVFVIAFAPFAYYGVIPNLMSRLFPFSRGLTHAYWAPNIWALYSFLDRVLVQLYLHVPGISSIISRYIGPESLVSRLKNSTASTKGLVGDVEFFIVPTITPKMSFILTLFYQILAVLPLLLFPTFKKFLGSITLCAFASFLFGWHVHEKAIMLVIIPFSFIAVSDRRLLYPFHTLVNAGYVSLFPLLFKSPEWLVKVLYTLVWCIIYFLSFNEVSKLSKSLSRRVFYMDRTNLIYILGLIPLTLTIGVLDVLSENFELLKRLEFLRLMMYSVYCALGIIGSWNGLSWIYFLDDTLNGDSSAVA